MSVFVVADMHFGDDVVRKLNRSQFETVDEMNSFIMERWNKTVSNEDTVYVLGDLGKKEYLSLYKRLNGKKILVLGNHDVEDIGEDPEIYLNNGFLEVHNHHITYNDYIELSHEPFPINSDYSINLHGHLHNANLDLKGYYNICLDLNFYKPVNIDYFKKYTCQLKKVRKKFGKEWYFDHYKFINRGE